MSKIGIIGAMDEEVNILKDEMEIIETIKIASMDFYIGKLESKNIVLVRCGIGKVNAAICTQVLIDRFDIDLVINTGVAGAMHDSLNILDVVVSDDVLYHDFDVTGFGYKLGEIPRMDSSIFKADNNLVSISINAAKEVLKGEKVFKGRVVSGDIFVSSAELKEKINLEFNAYCTEMEGAAIGHTCFLNNKPFVIIRAMSDKADGSAHANFNEFVEKASHNSKEIVKGILKQI
ncbi:5'-methylthioadenosine/adenosylhomocysteine nucleosidase [Serpentinicella alkaliphila]|uniref:adenosylhomocysteine nucleosidase n=1 Tax=Serpentinicella alkaliphila TaxID=1734049 RepID=A0A4V2T2R5_9FIRM|nr:5'-methylthioadenosine/adenosylhomocysteine nucleosidase [Serpentinicella alkaliphila]QUH26119.1 5'-methylthioadenosine/adenosylhomocysteine nucleosidase [Serpentinicella alkaliphila]TCP98433.1 adenosylhomocysteine nucleosidase [Serpentinicella alkaliphila]